MTRLRTFLLLVLISVIVTAGIQFSEQITEQTVPPDIDRTRDEVDYSIENFNLSLIDKQGAMQYHLSAASMLHYRLSDQTRLLKPNLELLRAAGDHWRIHASRGQVSPRGKDVSFEGLVRIERSANQAQESFIMTTDSLHINTVDNTVSTQDQVNLRGDGISMQARGMFADLDRDHIQLLAQVRVKYAP